MYMSPIHPREIALVLGHYIYIYIYRQYPCKIALGYVHIIHTNYTWERQHWSSGIIYRYNISTRLRQHYALCIIYNIIYINDFWETQHWTSNIMCRATYDVCMYIYIYHQYTPVRQHWTLGIMHTHIYNRYPCEIAVGFMHYIYISLIPM